MDLSGWEIGTKETIQLNGQWEFYWGKFLAYDDFQKVKPDMDYLWGWLVEGIYFGYTGQKQGAKS